MNYFAILVAAVGAYAVGMLWYTVLFGKAWRKEMGIHEGGQMKGMAATMAGGFVATLVMAFILAIFEGAIGVSTIQGGLILAFWLWLGFEAPIVANSVFYERRSWKLFAINAAHYLVALAVAAAIIAAWW